MQLEGFTQKELAPEADAQRNYLSHTEGGVKHPIFNIFFKLVAALQCRRRCYADIEKVKIE